MSPSVSRRPQQGPRTALEQGYLCCTWRLCVLTFAGDLSQAGHGANGGVLTTVPASAPGDRGCVLNKGAASDAFARFQGPGGRCVPCISESPGEKNASTPLCSHSLPLTCRQVIFHLLRFLTV